MPYVFKDRNPPVDWAEFKKGAPYGLLTPFLMMTWLVDWAAYYLGKWPLIELLEYLGSFSILFAAILYFAGASDRLKQKHYQAWQVINTAEGKGGSGGRIDALQELNQDRVSLIGVNVSGAYLQGLCLERARIRRANLADCDLRNADLRDASLPDSDLHYANLREANLMNGDLAGSRMDDTDLVDANLARANLSGVILDRADLRRANLDHIRNWQAIQSLDKANILGITNAPPGFVEWAKKKGAVEINGD
jgi:hypothetical protein